MSIGGTKIGSMNLPGADGTPRPLVSGTSSVTGESTTNPSEIFGGSVKGGADVSGLTDALTERLNQEPQSLTDRFKFDQQLPFEDAWGDTQSRMDQQSLYMDPFINGRFGANGSATSDALISRFAQPLSVPEQGGKLPIKPKKAGANKFNTPGSVKRAVKKTVDAPNTMRGITKRAKTQQSNAASYLDGIGDTFEPANARKGVKAASKTARKQSRNRLDELKELADEEAPNTRRRVNNTADRADKSVASRNRKAARKGRKELNKIKSRAKTTNKRARRIVRNKERRAKK